MSEGTYEWVEHPPHYNQTVPGIECIDVIEWLPANLAMVVKYCWRNGLKPSDDAVQDLQKAQFYLAREIERIKFIRAREAAAAAGTEDGR